MSPITFTETPFESKQIPVGFGSHFDIMSASTTNSGFNSSANDNTEKRMVKLKKFASKAINIAHRTVGTKDTTRCASTINYDHHHPGPIDMVKKFTHKVIVNKTSKKELRHEIFDQRRWEQQKNEAGIFYTVGKYFREAERERFHEKRRADQKREADIPSILRGYQSRMAVNPSYLCENEEERRWLHVSRHSGNDDGYESDLSGSFSDIEDEEYYSGDGDDGDDDSEGSEGGSDDSGSDSESGSKSGSDSDSNAEDSENERNDPLERHTTWSQSWRDSEARINAEIVRSGDDSTSIFDAVYIVNEREDRFEMIVNELWGSLGGYLVRLNAGGEGSGDSRSDSNPGSNVENYTLDDPRLPHEYVELMRSMEAANRREDEYSERGSSIFDDMGSIIGMWEAGRDDHSDIEYDYSATDNETFKDANRGSTSATRRNRRRSNVDYPERGSSIFDDAGSIIGMWEAGRDV